MTKPPAAWELAVDPTDIRRTQVRVRQAPTETDLAVGRALVRTERMGFSANNVLYAVLGHQNHYWDIYPTGDAMGIVPGWGYGRVVASGSPDLAVGDRIYGLLPMASHAELGVEPIAANRFRDPSPHRQSAAAAYHGYTIIPPDSPITGKLGDAYALLRPLFIVSWLASLYFADQTYFGARDLIITSASSKTAIALAYLAKASGAVENIVGLTSPANRAFVESLGYYDNVMLYAEVTQLPQDRKAVVFDVAGNAEVREQLHRRLGANLVHSATVGLAHWEASHETPPDLPGAPPTLFFAPDYMGRYAQAWGGLPVVMQRFEDALQPFVGAADTWLRLVEVCGAEAIEATYHAFLGGTRPPNEGLILQY